MCSSSSFLLSATLFSSLLTGYEPSPFLCAGLRGHTLDDLRPLAYTLWNTDFLSQATSRDLAKFYSTQDYVPQGNRIDVLNISKMYLELDQVVHSELYVVDPTLSETDRDARLAEIKAHTTAIQREVIAREATKKLANQRSAAHTFLVSAISTNLQRLYQATTCPFELFEHIKTRFESNPMNNNPTVIVSYLCTVKFTDESCIDTLSVELIDQVKRYRVSMTPPSFKPLDPSTISSVDFHNHIWNYYTLCTMSDTFISDKNRDRSPTRPFIHEGNRLNGFANTHILSHHFIPSSTLNRVLQRPNPPSVLLKVFKPGSAPLCDVFASPPHELPLIAATTLAPITDEPGKLPDHLPSPVDAGD
ncbi:hypothetical protein DYB28_003264 [Aphanomyces astaci]|uniref:Uncharacterized protein n=1 Tax=Aphanomyces astaci TaxID=112090 RepID=A0A9X8DYM8_APHAT|nr:hypothetical protein DYB28_003264 [Aphanomyces astaci]